MSEREELKLRQQFGDFVNFLCCSEYPVALDLPEPNSVNDNKYIQQFIDEYIALLTVVLCSASQTPSAHSFDIVSLFRNRSTLLDMANAEHVCSGECFPFTHAYGQAYQSVFASVDGVFRWFYASGRIFICATTGRCHYCTSSFQNIPCHEFIKRTCVRRFNGEHTVCELSSFLASDFVADIDETEANSDNEETPAELPHGVANAPAHLSSGRQRDNAVVSRGVNALVERNRQVSADEMAALQQRVRSAVSDVGISRVDQMKFAQDVVDLIHKFLSNNDVGKNMLRQHSIRRETESQMRTYAAACARSRTPLSLVMCMQIERTCVVDGDGGHSKHVIDHDILNRQARRYARCVLIVHRMWSMTLHNTKSVVLRDMVYAVLKIMHDGGLWIDGMEVMPHDNFLANVLTPIDSAGVKSGSINIMVKRITEVYTAHLRGVHKSRWPQNTLTALLSAVES